MSTTGSYERVYEIATSEAFINLVTNAISSPNSTAHINAFILDQAQARFGLSGQATRWGMILWLSTSRSPVPACITVSVDLGQLSSPSAVLIQHRGMALIQLFEAGADDTDVAATSPVPQNRIEAQGRVLLV